MGHSWQSHKRHASLELRELPFDRDFTFAWLLVCPSLLQRIPLRGQNRWPSLSSSAAGVWASDNHGNNDPGSAPPLWGRAVGFLSFESLRAGGKSFFLKAAAPMYSPPYARFLKRAGDMPPSAAAHRARPLKPGGTW